MKPGLPLAAVYRRAAARLRSDGWFQGAFAVTEDGREVDWSDPDALSFCALGALYREAAPDTAAEQRAVARPLLAALVRAGRVKVYDEGRRRTPPLRGRRQPRGLPRRTRPRRCDRPLERRRSPRRG